MGDPVTKENLEKLPTVIESHEEKLSPKNPNLLTPPSESSPMHKVSSATSIKLMGVPVKDNDPLGMYATQYGIIGNSDKFLISNF